VLLLLSSLFSSAQEPEKLLGVRLYTENDFLSPLAPNKDDNYTGGLKVEIVTNLAGKFFQNKILNPMRWVPVQQSFAFSVTIFTPTDLRSSDILVNERPYASYRSWNIGAGFMKENNRINYELAIGSMGTPLGGKVQRKIHRDGWFGSTRPVPQGWDYQIANGGSLAINVKVQFEHKLFHCAGKTNNFKWLSASWIHETNVGQFMINYSQGVRLFLFNVNHEIPFDEDTPSIVQLDGGKTKKKNFSFFCFLTPRLKAMFHNSTLTGQLLSRESVHVLPPTDVNKGLLEFDAGAQLQVYCLRLGYFLYGRSREYKSEEKSFHHWGGLYLGVVAKW